MQLPKNINEYLRAWAAELGERILQTYPPLQGFDDAVSPLTGQLLRKPFPAQTLAMMGVVRRWNEQPSPWSLPSWLRSGQEKHF